MICRKDPWELNNLAEEKEVCETYCYDERELEAWMRQQGDTGAQMDVKIKKQ